jgi:hypothetical protein
LQKKKQKYKNELEYGPRKLFFWPVVWSSPTGSTVACAAVVCTHLDPSWWWRHAHPRSWHGTWKA